MSQKNTVRVGISGLGSFATVIANAVKKSKKALMTMGVHQADTFIYLFGPVKTVFAFFN